jgi:hypothetical protein
MKEREMKKALVAAVVTLGVFGLGGTAGAHEVVAPPAGHSNGVGTEVHLGPAMNSPSMGHSRAHSRGLYTACEKSPVITKAAQGC